MILPRETFFEKLYWARVEQAYARTCFHPNFDVRVMSCGARHDVCTDCGAVPSATMVTCERE